MAVGPAAVNSKSSAFGIREMALGILGALVLTFVFWDPLWRGGGVFGADVSAYFLPQKAFYGEQLRAGSLPLWNNRIGWGYPQLAESQTGVFYPLHLPLYRLLDTNTAFNVSIIGHYALAFIFMWLLARRLGLTPIGSALAALVYTYGWFPPRIGLEWTIVGGAWLPLALWCVEQFLSSRFWRYAIGLAIVLAVQMLAGHFMIAFMTQLTLVLYVPLRLWFGRSDSSETPPTSRAGPGLALALAFITAFPLAAVQLLPTWELRQNSQRHAGLAQHNPGYGVIPVNHLMQIATPSWFSYPQPSSFWEQPDAWAKTNPVEAHLYFGLLPLALALRGLWEMRKGLDRRLAILLGLGVAAVVYTTGALLPVTKHLPGFGYFEGPGRFGIVTTLAAASIAGFGFDRMLRRRRPVVRWLYVCCVFGATILDLRLVGEQVVTFTSVLPERVISLRWLYGAMDEPAHDVHADRRPPIQWIDDSKLGRVLAEYPGPARLYSSGRNLPSVFKAATLPVYLGFAPAVYFEPEGMVPGHFDWGAPPVAEQIDWLRRAGVTHLLSFVPLDGRTWPVRLAWQGPDPYLNVSQARGLQEPLYLYELDSTRERVAWSDGEDDPPPRLVEYQPTRVVIETEAKRDNRLILTDLPFPGWQVTVDGQPANGVTVEGVFRGVDLPAGKHTVIWTYRPTSVYWGVALSLAAWIAILAVGHVRYRRASWPSVPPP